jgi:hypothetical protein
MSRYPDVSPHVYVHILAIILQVLNLVWIDCLKGTVLGDCLKGTVLIDFPLSVLMADSNFPIEHLRQYEIKFETILGQESGA